MELYQLKSFVAVAEEGNLTRAAERLFSSQPAVSAHIKALEEEMGVSLFDRATRGMVLTRDGEKLLEKAEAVLEHVQDLNELARDLQANPSGSLRIGVLLDGDALPLDAISRRLYASHPGIQLEFTHSNSGVITKGILNGDLDLGFAEGSVESPLLKSLLIGHSKVLVVAAPQYREAFESDKWEDLQALPWAFKTPECSYYQLMRRVSQAHGLSLNKRYIIDHETTCLQFARNGVALAVANETVVQDDLRRGSLIAWKGFQGVLEVNLLCLSKRVQERAVSAFLQAATETLQLS